MYRLLFLIFLSFVPIHAALIDEAYIHITWFPSTNVTHTNNISIDISIISTICYHCEPQNVLSLSYLNHMDDDVIIDSRWDISFILTLTIYDTNITTSTYETILTPEYHAHYSIHINTTCDDTCTITTSIEKDAAGDLYYVLIAIWFVAMGICMFIWKFTQHIRKQLIDVVATKYEEVTTWWKGTEKDVDDDDVQKDAATEPSKPEPSKPEKVATTEPSREKDTPSIETSKSSPKSSRKTSSLASIRLSTIKVSPAPTNPSISDTPKLEVRKISFVAKRSLSESDLHSAANPTDSTPDQMQRSATDSSIVIEYAQPSADDSSIVISTDNEQPSAVAPATLEVPRPSTPKSVIVDEMKTSIADTTSTHNVQPSGVDAPAVEMTKLSPPDVKRSESITIDIKPKTTRSVIFVEPISAPKPTTSTPAPRIPSIIKQNKRLVSLDTFRGLNVCVMIFVNYGGGYYWFLQHATWNGMTVADCVFPFFLFMMGVSITIAMYAMNNRGVSRGQQLYHIFRRTIIFFIFGLIISNTSFDNFRVSGVLQRFAVCWLICTITIMLCYQSKKSVNQNPPNNPMSLYHSCISYILPHHLITIGECVLITCMIIINLSLTFLWDVPDCGRGYTGPGGIGDYGMYSHCTGGAAGYIDRLVLGSSHLLQDPTSKPIYLTGPSDPEGILGYTTSIVLTYFGIITGRVFLSTQYTWKGRITRFMIFSVILGVTGVVLCGATRDGGLIPLNKNLWSLSYILVTAALALLILSFLYYVQDICQLWNGWVFHDMGKNSMMVYVGSELASYITGMQFVIDVMNPETTNFHAIYLLLNTLSVWFWLLVSYLITHTKY